MTSQKSKPAERHRFSGPELSDLLDRVVAEHGETAAIAAVNRVRSGGVAGFFCREEFEIIVDEERVPSPAPDRRAGPESQPQPEAEAEAESESEGEAEAEGKAGFGAEPAATEGDGSDRSDRFLALLERRLDEASTAEADSLLRHVNSAGPGRLARPDRRPAVRRTEPSDAPIEPPDAPVAPAPAPSVDRGIETVGSRPWRPTVAAERQPVFWTGLVGAREELDSFLPLDSTFVAVVGPLPDAAGVVDRLRSMPTMESASVVVLTDRAGLIGEPMWELVRTGRALIETGRERAGGDGSASPVGSAPQPTILVIDVPVDLPHWVGPLQHRLRAVGVGLFRYAVSGRPTGSDLERYRQGSDVPYVVDLTSRVSPDRVVELVADRHPVASVAGVDLGAEMLIALRNHVGARRSTTR